MWMHTIHWIDSELIFTQVAVLHRKRSLGTPTELQVVSSHGLTYHTHLKAITKKDLFVMFFWQGSSFTALLMRVVLLK